MYKLPKKRETPRRLRPNLAEFAHVNKESEVNHEAATASGAGGQRKNNAAENKVSSRTTQPAGIVRPRRFAKRIARVGKHWKFKAAVVVKRGGREICNPSTPEGRAEYFWRKLLMWTRQEGRCCNCRGRLLLKECSFEHENGRGAAKQDDRIALFDDDGRFIRHLNGVSHGSCNSERGSRRTEIYHGNNTVLEIESL